MMHKKNLVVAIRTGGKILRESSDRVELPFGSEYEIILKNLDTVRQQVNIQIDGGEETGWLVLNPGEKQAIERFPRGNMDEGNRFKFIERTKKVEDHRGVGAEDGLVRVEFKREKVVPLNAVWNTNHVYTYPFNAPTSVVDFWKYSNSFPASAFDPCATVALGGHRGQFVNSSGRGVRGQSMQCASQDNQNSTVTMDCFSGPIANVTTANVATGSLPNAQAVYYDKVVIPNPVNDAGITVDGSLSDQHFISVQGFDCEAPEVLVLHLVGAVGGKPVKVAKTVKVKLECGSCGTKNKSIEKWCRECGTHLQRF